MPSRLSRLTTRGAEVPVLGQGLSTPGPKSSPKGKDKRNSWSHPPSEDITNFIANPYLRSAHYKHLHLGETVIIEKPEQSSKKIIIPSDILS